MGIRWLNLEVDSLFLEASRMEIRAFGKAFELLLPSQTKNVSSLPSANKGSNRDM